MQNVHVKRIKEKRGQIRLIMSQIMIRLSRTKLNAAKYIQLESKVKEVSFCTKHLKWFCNYCLNYYEKCMKTKQDLTEIKGLMKKRKHYKKDEESRKKTY